MGQFDVSPFMVDGKPHQLVANPPGVFSAEKTRTLAGHLTKLAEAQGRIFGGLPYKKFVYFYFFRAAEASCSVLERQNSFVSLWNPDALPLPDDMVGQASHEFFHLWNVKRIRPVQMWPYDYARENETPLLWVSEGFTGYYASLTSYRAGLRDARSFIGDTARAILEVEGNEARRYISPSDSSTSTWIDYASPLPFRISYYPQGRNLAGLLDLSIRHDTNGASGLDEVMRTLFTDFYQRGRGFSTEDLIRVINRISRKSYEGFFTRYVSGTDVPPYETIFGYAGYQLERAARKIPFLGVNLDTLGRVTGFPPGSDAATSRFAPGRLHRACRWPDPRRSTRGDDLPSPEREVGSEHQAQDQARWRGTGTGHDCQVRRAPELPDRRDPVAGTGTVEDSGELAQTVAAAGCTWSAQNGRRR